MHELVIRPDWAQQIGQLRERLTDDTGIIRWGNNFYRCCRAGAPVALCVATHDRSVSLPLRMRPGDLYITEVGAGSNMGRYGSLTDGLAVSAGNFDHAVRRLARGDVHGDEAFSLRSLVVFCVAEALRFDTLAHDVGFALHTVNVAGGARPMPLARWWPTVHAWGKACDAVWAGLDPALRSASLLPAGARSSAQRSLFARASYERLGGDVLEAAKGAAVLKRPAA